MRFLLLLALGCGPKKGPEAAAPPDWSVCLQGLSGDWEAAAPAHCQVPWAEAVAWPQELGVVVDDGEFGAGPSLSLVEEDGSGEPVMIDLPWTIDASGTGRLAGDLRILDGPEGEVVCEGPPPTHARRVLLQDTEVVIPLALPGDCASDPPVYTGSTQVLWERPVPGGGVVALGPAEVLAEAGRGERPPPVEEGCAGAAFDLRDLRAEGRCTTDWAGTGAFPGPEELAVELPALSGRGGETLRFELVWANQTEAPLTVDLRLSMGEPLTGWRVYQGGEEVVVPPGCSVESLSMGEAFRVRLDPGGRLSTPARVVLQPGGEGLYVEGGRACRVKLRPGEYEVEVTAPDRDPRRKVRVPVVVER